MDLDINEKIIKEVFEDTGRGAMYFEDLVDHIIRKTNLREDLQIVLEQMCDEKKLDLKYNKRSISIIVLPEEEGDE